MKLWFIRSFSLSIIIVFVLTLVPVASAQEDDLGTIFSGGEWLLACGEYNFAGIDSGLASITLKDRIAPGFYLVEEIYIYSAQYGVVGNFTDQLDYDEFSTFSGYWNLPVPIDGYSTLVDKVYDSGGGLHSVSSATADCTTGEISIGQSSVYGPKVPKGFELRSLSCSSAVLDVPGGEQVDEAAVYAGQSWFVNPTSKDGYTEIFVGGFTTGYIPTECIGGVPSFSAE